MPAENPLPYEDLEKENPNWKRTVAITNRLGKSPAYEAADEKSKNGYFEGRPVIGRDTPIHGGVYLGGHAREALVVDEKHGELPKVYENLVKRIPNLRDTDNVLSQTYFTVLEAMPTNQERAERVGEMAGPDEKIALDSYILNKCGVCRHQALLAGYLVEKLINEENMGGRVSIDRNEISEKGAHAWVRYEDRNGEAYIIDPAQRYVGKEKDVPNHAWNYSRPQN